MRFYVTLGLAGLAIAILWTSRPRPAAVRSTPEPSTYGRREIERLRPLRDLLNSRRWPRAMLPTAKELAATIRQRLGDVEIAPLPGGFDAYVREYAPLDPDWAAFAGYDDSGVGTRHDDEAIRARMILDLRAMESCDDAIFEAHLAHELYGWVRGDLRTTNAWLPVMTIAGYELSKLHGHALNLEKRLEALPAAIALSRRLLDRPPRLRLVRSIDGVRRALDVVKTLHAPAAEKALEEYLDFLEREVKPRASDAVGIGYDAFAFALNIDVGREVAPEGAARETLDDFDAAMRELDALLQSVPDADTFLDAMKKRHPRPQDLLTTYRDEIDRARDAARGLVTIPEGETLELAETPPMLEGWIDLAGYEGPGAFARTRRGVFLLTSAKDDGAMERHTRCAIRHTVWHESYPGHHVQELLGRDAPALHRAYGSITTVEGWGTYVEELLHEQGACFGDMDDRATVLLDRAARAERAAIDLVFNIAGLEYDAAIALMNRIQQVENDAQAERTIGDLAGPAGYQTSYWLGAREVRRIRESCRRRLGARFSLREFHDRFLRCGSIPLAAIDKILEREWK